MTQSFQEGPSATYATVMMATDRLKPGRPK